MSDYHYVLYVYVSDGTRIFTTVRVPCKGEDILVTHQPARNIIVLVNHRIYSLDVLREDDTPYTSASIEAALKQICSHARSQTDTVLSLGVLTAADRDVWYVMLYTWLIALT